jgi:hypothetical protein
MVTVTTAGELMRQADVLRAFTDSLVVSCCSGVEGPNKTHARYRATCMAGFFTALLNHLLIWLPIKRLCTLCCRLHARRIAPMAQGAYNDRTISYICRD